MEMFFNLIQVALGKKKWLDHTPSEKKWQELYLTCQLHAIAGVAFLALDKLSNYGIKPPLPILYDWIGLSERIKQQNSLLNERCLQLQKLFAKADFRTCILKGQGNALMYSEPLLRQSGDIDIWVEGKIHNIVNFLKTQCDESKLTLAYHHTEFPIWDDVEIEVHWRPSWRSSPFYNYRLQKWLRGQTKYQFDNIDIESGLHIPTWEFNVVYQLHHMYRHLLEEGLGLRQVMDYYYLLLSAKDNGRCKNEDVRKTLSYLGLWKFAGAMMYVLREIFLLEEKYMIAPVDEKRGVFLLREIMQSGNFGQADVRNNSLHQKKGIRRSLARMKRQYRFLKDYPSEVLCAPFQVYHVIWRKLKLWKWE